MSLNEKRQRLESLIRELGSAIVAYSGGVDSAVVLAVSHAALGAKALAVTAESDSLPARELEAAKRLARWIGAEHIVIRSREVESEKYRSNPVDRCYYCKSELYARLKTIAAERGYACILNGTNLDDLGDYRPGLDAAAEASVRSPLRDAGFAKRDVRALARELGLPVAEKPAAACLASRIPYGEAITPEKLAMVERAEDFLLALGFSQVRVRHHGDVARIELSKADMPGFLRDEIRESVQKRFKEIGFKYVTLDIEGYRAGSLNEAIGKAKG
jgi:uncharacterized protein